MAEIGPGDDHIDYTVGRLKPLESDDPLGPLNLPEPLVASDPPRGEWWWKAAATAMFGMLAGLLLKGFDEWQTTNDALTQLTADVKYQIQRVGEREARLDQVEKNLNLLYEKTVERFEQRREQAERLVNQIDERLDRLERFAPENSPRPLNRRE